MRAPDLDDLVGDGVAPGEHALLRRAHDLLVEADPPPELPPDLAVPPAPPTTSALPMPRRYRSTAVVAAVILALALFGAGWLLGGGGGGRQEVQSVALAGDGAARGELVVLRGDDAGNWPLELTVRDLPAPPAGTAYELVRTRRDGTEERVGAFVSDGEETTVTLNVTSPVSDADRWVVVVSGTTAPVLRTAGT